MDENIRFDESEYVSSAPVEADSWLTRLIIKTGLAKDSVGAQKVLLVVVVLIVVATIAIFWMNNSSSTPPPLPPGVQLPQQ